MAVKRLIANGFVYALVCSDPEIGGPAGDYHHHRRNCRAARLARWAGRASAEDKQTGWVTINGR